MSGIMPMINVPDVVQYGRIQAHLVAFIADTMNDDDKIPDEVPLTGTVVLTPTVEVVRFPTTVPPRTAVVQPLRCPVIGGDLYPPDTVVGALPAQPGVVVVASDQPVGLPDTVQWTATFELVGVNVQPGSVTFNVPANGVVDLTTVMPVTPTPGTVVVVSTEDRERAEAAAVRAEQKASAAASSATAAATSATNAATSASAAASSASNAAASASAASSSAASLTWDTLPGKPAAIAAGATAAAARTAIGAAAQTATMPLTLLTVSEAQLVTNEQIDSYSTGIIVFPSTADGERLALPCGRSMFVLTTYVTPQLIASGVTRALQILQAPTGTWIRQRLTTTTWVAWVSGSTLNSTLSGSPLTEVIPQEVTRRTPVTEQLN